MNDNQSIYEMIAGYYPDVQVRLHTPAHQGIALDSDYFNDRTYAYDLPFFNRDKFYGVEQLIAKLYQTNHTFFLTGGATQGILIACALLGRNHRQVALGINSHLSIIHGCILGGIDPYFIPSRSLMPTASEVIEALEAAKDKVSALFLTHPSYEGQIIDLEAIAQYCRQNNITFFIDEAHGTHFPFLTQEIPTGLTVGADLVVHSLHKFVGSLVQTALLHIPSTSSLDLDEVISTLSLYETTSRSNLLLLSIEEAIKQGFQEARAGLFRQAEERCEYLRRLLDSFGKVLFYHFNGDPLKLFLSSDRVSGDELAALLLEHGVDHEYSDQTGVLLIFAFQHTEKDFDYVERVLQDVFLILLKKNPRKENNKNCWRMPIMGCSPRKAFFAAKRTKIPLEKAKGLISCQSLKKIPPCIPILFPGEEITDWHISQANSDILIEVMDEVI